MKYGQFESLISAQRLSRYLLSCANDPQKTISLYRANIRLSLAFLAVVAIFEVVLRNKIDGHYREKFGADAADRGWLLQSVAPGGFLTHPGCQKSANKIRKIVTSAGDDLTHDKLIASLSFGFWKYLFAGRQFMAGGSSLLEIFPELPPHHNQSAVFARLHRLNAIRNRIAHHEPVCFGINNTIASSYVRTQLQQLTDILSWMGIDSSKRLFGLSKLQKEIKDLDAMNENKSNGTNS
jgi:hypothetical protein